MILPYAYWIAFVYLCVVMCANLYGTITKKDQGYRAACLVVFAFNCVLMSVLWTLRP